MLKTVYYVIAAVLVFLVVFSLLNYRYFVLRYISMCGKSDSCPKLMKQSEMLKKTSKTCGGPLTDDMTIREVYKKIANLYWDRSKTSCEAKLVGLANGSPCPCK